MGRFVRKIGDLEYRPSSSIGIRSNHLGGVASQSRLEGSSMGIRFLSSHHSHCLSPALKDCKKKGPTHLSKIPSTFKRETVTANGFRSNSQDISRTSREETLVKDGATICPIAQCVSDWIRALAWLLQRPTSLRGVCHKLPRLIRHHAPTALSC